MSDLCGRCGSLDHYDCTPSVGSCGHELGANETGGWDCLRCSLKTIASLRSALSAETEARRKAEAERDEFRRLAHWGQDLRNTWRSRAEKAEAERAHDQERFLAGCAAPKPCPCCRDKKVVEKALALAEKVVEAAKKVTDRIIEKAMIRAGLPVNTRKRVWNYLHDPLDDFLAARDARQSKLAESAESIVVWVSMMPLHQMINEQPNSLFEKELAELNKRLTAYDSARKDMEK